MGQNEDSQDPAIDDFLSDDDLTDFGKPKGDYDTDGNFNRYIVSSLLQKAVRRNDEEVAAWSAFELARSGFGWNLWSRLNLYIFEDLKAAQPVALEIRSLESIAKFKHDMKDEVGVQAGMRAAILAARAEPAREATYINGYHDRFAKERKLQYTEDDFEADYLPVVTDGEMEERRKKLGVEFGEKLDEFGTDSSPTQVTLTGEEAEEEDDDDDTLTNDKGEILRKGQTYGGYHIEAVVDVFDEAVKSWKPEDDIYWEERSTWAAWELVRSGFENRFWKEASRLATEVPTVGEQIVSLLSEYEKMANKVYEDQQWQHNLCAIHTALTLSRQELVEIDDTSDIDVRTKRQKYEEIARKRGLAIAKGEKPTAHFPVRKKEIQEGGKFDVCLDKHTREGKQIGRGWRHFRVHAGRVRGGEHGLSEKARRIDMELDHKGYREFQVDFDEDEIEHSVSAVDDDNPWNEPNRV